MYSAVQSQIALGKVNPRDMLLITHSNLKLNLNYLNVQKIVINKIK